MTEPLSNALAEAVELRSKLVAYDKDKERLAQTNGRLSAANKQVGGRCLPGPGRHAANLARG
jgi:hypothetical protein